MTGSSSRRRLLRTVGALGVGALAGCGYRPGGGDVRWTTDRSGSDAADAVYAPTGGVLGLSRSTRRYDFDRDVWLDGGVVTAYDPDTGDERGETTTAAPVRCDAGGPDGVVLGTDSRRLVGVGSDGSRRFRVDLGAVPRAVASGDGVVAVLTAAGDLRGFDADGTDRWSLSVVDESSATAAEQTPTDDADGDDAPVGRGSVLAAAATGVALGLGGTDARLVFVGPDGTRRWTRETEGVVDDRRRVPPVVADDRVVSVEGGAVTAHAVDDGDELWTVSAASTRGLAVAGDTSYTLDRAGLTARSLADGRRLWRFPSADDESSQRFDTGPVATVDGSFVTAGTRLFAVSPDGTARWRVRLESRPRSLALTPATVVRTGDDGLVAHWRRDQF